MTIFAHTEHQIALYRRLLHLYGAAVTTHRALPLPTSLLGLAMAAGAISADEWVMLPDRVLGATSGPLRGGLVVALLTAATGAGAIAARHLVAGLRHVGLRRPVETWLLAAAFASAGAGAFLLAFGADQPSVVGGTVLAGAGLGLYWTGAQRALAGRSEAPGSASRYAAHYTAYTAGTLLGALGAGAASAMARHGGLDQAGAARAGLALGLVLAAAGLGCWVRARPWLGDSTCSEREDPGPGRLASTRALHAQGPDLALVAALALVGTLAPLELAVRFGAGPATVALFGTLAGSAKATGSLTTARLARRLGARVTLVAALGTAAGLGFIAAASPVIWVALPALAGFTCLAGGSWPLVVDTLVASTPPERRASLALGWSAREYPVMALVLAPAGWLLANPGSSAAPEATGALLCLAAAAALGRRLLPGRSQATPGPCAPTTSASMGCGH